MNIIVCIKQVPNTNEVKINQETGTLIREGVESIINPDDKNAIEEALSLKAQTGGTVTIVSMGPPQAKGALKEALACPGPIVLDCMIDQDLSVFPMVPAGAPIEDVFDAEDLAKKEQEKD